MTDINIGEKLDATNVKLEEWPKDRVPEGAIMDLADLEEQYPRTRLYAGEPILVAKLMDSRDRGSKALTIPKGFRVVSVKVSVESSVSGLVQPGDRVDLLVFLRKSGEVPETGTKTILRDVNVFSVDGETERSIDAEGQTRNVRTVSLLVSPVQAESVMLASELGQLYLTLRSPDDPTESTSDGINVQSLLGTAGESANTQGQKEDETGSQFIEWLSSNNDPTPEPVMVVESEPVWTMQVMTSDGLREYRWRDEKELPEEVAIGGAVAGSNSDDEFGDEEETPTALNEPDQDVDNSDTDDGEA